MEAATLSPTAKSEFRNDSPGTCGVIVIENGREKALPLGPGQSVFLTQQEQILTANAPREEKDNPFTNGTLTLITPATEMANRRPIGDPSLGGTAQPDPEAVAAREEREAAERAKQEAERVRTAEAQAQAERPQVPRRSPQTKTEGEGATPARTSAPAAPDAAEETATASQSAPAEGERAAAEEVATPAAEEAS